MGEKFAVREGNPDSHQPYEHLVPIVEALLANGNRLADPMVIRRQGLPSNSVFYNTQGGWTCLLAEPIDFDLLRRTFELPTSIHLNEERDVIACDRTWIEISGNWKANPSRAGEDLA